MTGMGGNTLSPKEQGSSDGWKPDLLLLHFC